MSVFLFDGAAFSNVLFERLKKQIASLPTQPRIVSLYFQEDRGSVLYTRLKQEMAGKLGVSFHAIRRSFHSDFTDLQRLVFETSHDKQVTGFMIQKPTRQSFADALTIPTIRSSSLVKNVVSIIGEISKGKDAFDPWWRKLVDEINLQVDVDCLAPVNLERVYRGVFTTMPATVRAVLSIIDEAVPRELSLGKRVAVVGRSELVGKPLAYVLAKRGYEVWLCSSVGVAAESRAREFTSQIRLRSLAEALPVCDSVISATGQASLIHGEMIKEGAVVIDVGEPYGDIHFESVSPKAAFLTPVPGGVGPVTVVSLFANLVEIIN
jgi:methylenetetrahydrofolate dehydrogenase (NADP+)/methenyltetrahydrofolate cyclohydrolase